VTLSRRTLLGAGVALPLVAACDKDRPTSSPHAQRIHYGELPLQYADLRRPARHPVGTLVLLHGGYWMPGYGLDQLDPIANLMTRAGWATWNVEYRPIGDGGSWPDPMTDVALAVDLLETRGLADNVVLLGHSAGGQLAVWAASRTARTPGGPPKVRPAGAISLSGVLDLTHAAGTPGSAEPVTAFAGGSPAGQPEHYALSDPALLVPAACPVWVVHADDDQVIRADQGTSYVARAKAAGGQVELVDVPGDHFTLIDPRAPSFPTIRRLITQAGR
jgi:acetyl esterase/lipase